jgi:hypothetical protein
VATVVNRAAVKFIVRAYPPGGQDARDQRFVESLARACAMIPLILAGSMM